MFAIELLSGYAGIILIIVAGVLILIDRRPQIGFISLLFALSFLTFLEDSQGMYQLIPVLKYLLIGLTGIIISADLIRHRKTIVLTKERTVITVLVVLFVVWLLALTFLRSNNLEAGISNLLINIQYIPLLLYAPYCLTQTTVRTRLLPFLYLLLLSIVVYGLAEALVGFTGTLSTLNRADSILPNPNMLGAYLAGMIVFFWPVISEWSCDRRSEIAAYLGLLMAAVLLVFTFSRRAWVGFIVGGIFVIIVNSDRRTHWVVPVLGIGFIATGLLLSPKTFIQRFESIVYLKKSGGRFSEQLPGLINTISESLWKTFLGIDPAGGTIVSEMYFNSTAPVIDIYYATLVVNYGIIGLIFYLSFYGYLCLVLLRAGVSRTGFEQKFCIGTLAFLLIIFIMNTVGRVSTSMPVSILLWVIIGSSLIALESKVEGATNPSSVV